MTKLRTNTTKFQSLLLFAVAIGIAVTPGSSIARTKLVALPDRQTLALNLDHPSASLVTEERVLNLQKGENQVDFSWQGVQIDPATIQFEVLESPDTVRLINVSFPPGENALVWNIYSPETRQERVRIYYLLSGLERTVSYRQSVAADEKSAALECKYKINNLSGEDLSQARIFAGFAKPWTTDLRNSEAREVTLFDAKTPVQKLYIYKVPSSREQTPLYYLLRNTEEWGLGRFKLPAGKMRIFQADPQGSTVFLGEDWVKELAIREKTEVSLGVARDVVVKRQVVTDRRQNEKRDPAGTIVVSDRVVETRYEIENFKNTPVTLKIVEPMSDNWGNVKLIGGKTRWERKDNQTLELYVELPAKGKKQTVQLAYLQKNLLGGTIATPEPPTPMPLPAQRPSFGGGDAGVQEGPIQTQESQPGE